MTQLACFKTTEKRILANCRSCMPVLRGEHVEKDRAGSRNSLPLDCICATIPRCLSSRPWPSATRRKGLGREPGPKRQSGTSRRRSRSDSGSLVGLITSLRNSLLVSSLAAAWMSEMGHQRSSGDVRVTSAFALIATRSRTSHHVGDGPQADIRRLIR